MPRPKGSKNKTSNRPCAYCFAATVEVSSVRCGACHCRLTVGLCKACHDATEEQDFCAYTEEVKAEGRLAMQI